MEPSRAPVSEHAVYPLVCDRCGDVIGAYEPMVVVVAGDLARRTSAVADPAAVSAAAARYHDACFAAGAGAGTAAGSGTTG